MEILKSFFGAVFSRAILLGAAVLLLGLALWFAGPSLGVDGSRPLAPVGARLVAIGLLAVLALLWLAGGPVVLILLPILCLFLWFAGPALSVGDARPLESTLARGMCVAAVVLACAVWGVCWLLVKVSEEPAYLQKLRLFRPTDTAEAARRLALLPVAAKVAQAVAQLKLLQAGGFWRRTFEKNRHVYALPWFLLIGPPGAGKTSLLRQSGLQFPLAPTARPGASAGQGDAGTPDCEWWLANEAVLIDTAGRYCLATSGDGVAGVPPTPDRDEWHGLLGLLRKHRPRAPVNGVVLAISVADLLHADDARRARQAATLRERLADIRRELGIRCPVYLLVTKADLLSGFAPFFQSLTSEGRTQVWGFTFDRHTFGVGPGLLRARSAQAVAAQREILRRQVHDELAGLVARVDSGLRIRLKEEFETERRRALFALPQEFEALAEPLVRTIDEIFLDSRFDDTQSRHALRGVYFSSAEQANNGAPALPADRHTLVGQLAGVAGFGREAGTGGPAAVLSDPGHQGTHDNAHQKAHEKARDRQGFFLHDLLIRIVVPEAHLVRPNLRWEFRFRLMRLLGHGLAALVFGWLAVALLQSGRNNRVYLDAVGARTGELHARVAALLGRPRQSDAPAVLEAARSLPLQAGVSAAVPPPRFGYGLYAAPPVLAAAVEVYMRLQEIMLLPGIVRRMESVLQSALKDGDAPLAYATLRAYLLLHDPARYAAEGGAADVLAWVQHDASVGSAGSAGTVIGAVHLQALFSGRRHVQAASPADAALVRDTRRFLDADATGQRIYERAKADMQADAPPDFTLIRAVGPQVGTVLARRDKLPLESGVPGLFTHAGYHGLFDARLPAFVAKAGADDSWVMGRPEIGAETLLEDVRRRYLDEYSARWTDFLESIRAAGTEPAADADADERSGTALGFDLSVLRQLAAPDSPLTRLVRAAVQETTLSQSVPNGLEGGTAGIGGKSVAAAVASVTPGTAAAGGSAERRLSAATPGASADIRVDRRLERDLVDKRFAALREVATGQADAPGEGMPATAQRPGIEALTASVNDFYTRLVVADTALSAGGLPPGGTDIAARLSLEADKLPAPMREVLGALARDAGGRVALGGAGILRKQAQVQFDRLLGLLAQNVGDPCRRGVEGRYPFVEATHNAQDAAIEDVARIFATGGAADEYFSRYLAPFVDTSVRPWRYRTAAAPPLAALVALADAPGGAAPGAGPGNAPTLIGELLKLLARGGPDLEAFYRVQQIRELFFSEDGGRTLHWKLKLSVLELDPTITDLMIDIDGQGQRYIHGPVQALPVDWPGPRGGSMASLTANPRISGATSVLSLTGPWALLRLLDKGRVLPSATAGRVSVEVSFDGRRALLGISAGSQPNPLNSDVLRGFRCPGVRPAVGSAA